MSKEIIIQLIVILNGDRDPYYDSLKDLLNELPFDARLIYCDTPGVSHARNIGLDNTGECDFVMFVDDDDMLSSNYVPVMVDKMSNQPGCLVQSSTGIKDDGKEIQILDRCSGKNFVKDDTFRPIQGRKYLNSVCSKLFRRDMIGETRFDENISISEDALFMFALSPRIKHLRLAADCCYVIMRSQDSSSRREKNMFKLFNDMTKFIISLSRTYFKRPFVYDFLLFTTRVLASVKFFFSRLAGTY